MCAENPPSAQSTLTINTNTRTHCVRKLLTFGPCLSALAMFLHTHTRAHYRWPLCKVACTRTRHVCHGPRDPGLRRPWNGFCNQAHCYCWPIALVRHHTPSLAARPQTLLIVNNSLQKCHAHTNCCSNTNYGNLWDMRQLCGLNLQSIIFWYTFIHTCLHGEEEVRYCGMHHVLDIICNFYAFIKCHYIYLMPFEYGSSDREGGALWYIARGNMALNLNRNTLNMGIKAGQGVCVFALLPTSTEWDINYELYTVCAYSPPYKGIRISWYGLAQNTKQNAHDLFRFDFPFSHRIC